MWMHSGVKVAWISILHLQNSSFTNCGNIPWLRFTSSPPLKGREPCHCVHCRQEQRWWCAASGCCSVPKSCPALCNPMDCGTPSFPVHHLLECVQIQVYWVSDATQPSHPLSSPSPAFNLSQHQSLFQWVKSLHQVAKVLEFQLQHHSFQWIFMIDFLRIDWFDLLVGQGTLKSLLQHNSKASILWCSAFFMVQHSHPYTTTGKITALTIWTFGGKVISLFFNTLSRFVITFLYKDCGTFLT